LIDYFALALGHGLLVIAFFRLVTADALDDDEVRPVEPESNAESESRNPAALRPNRRVGR